MAGSTGPPPGVDALSMPSLSPAHVRIDIAARTDRGRVREGNEDAFLVYRVGRYLDRVASNVPEADLPPHFEDVGHLMIVADGLGGHEAGDVASRSALYTTLQLILRAPRWALKLDDPATRDAELRDLMSRGRTYLSGVHAALRHQADRDPALAGMGTTLTGAYALGLDLLVLHVGDSKAYRWNGTLLERITRDHTVAQEYADMGMIPQDQVPNHHMHHVLTRALGGPDDQLEGDMHHLVLQPGDRVLLCSDGLTDLTTEADISGILGTHPTSQAACDALVELALERGGRDNVTVIVAGFSGV